MNGRVLPAVAVPGDATATLLNIGELRLVMPQREVCAVEAAAAMDLLDPAPHAVGWISHEDQPWPVYCLDSGLALLAQVPSQRRACILLQWSGGYVGFLCDDVSVVKQLEGRRYALPSPMVLPHSPIQGLLAHADSLACLTDAPRLTAHILQLALD